MSSPTLSEQLRRVQEALESCRTDNCAEDYYDHDAVYDALALMPSIIERVEDMEREAELTAHLGLGTTRGAALPVGEGLVEAVQTAIRTHIEARTSVVDIHNWHTGVTESKQQVVGFYIGEGTARAALAVAIPSIEAPLLAKLAEREALVKALRGYLRECTQGAEP